MAAWTLDERYWRRQIASEIEQYARDTDQHVGFPRGECFPGSGDRCDITAALRVVASRVLTRGSGRE